MFLKKFLLFGLLAAILPAFAEEAADRKTATSLKYVTHELDTRQNKFTAEQNKAMEYTDSAGTVQQRTVKSDLGSDTSDTSLPMVGGVNTKLATKQDDIAAINDHTAVTYTGTAGQIGAKGIYQATESYVEQSDNLIDAKTFNAALKNGLESEFICSEYKPGTDLCWVYSIHNNGPVNLFDMSLIPTNSQIAHNADGSITMMTGAGITANTGKKLSQFAPGLQVGKTYKFSMNTTGTYKQIYLNAPANTYWHNEEVHTITQDMLNSIVILYASGVNTTATISDIQITEENPEMPFTTLVPAGYTPLEYIQSSGTQWINTGISGPTRWVGKGQSVQNTTKSQVLLGGNSVGAGGTFIGSVANGNVWTTWGNPPSTTYPITTAQDFDLSFVNGGVSGRIGGTVVAQTASQNLNMTWVICWHANTLFPYIGKLFYFKAYQNDALVRDFVPARHDSDNKVGLYDRVNGVFYTNAATSGEDFTAGPDISNIVYIPQNQ